MNDESTQLTPDENALIKEYLQKVEELTAQEPPPLSGEEWGQIMDRIRANGGAIPAEYADRIGINNENGQPAYYDILEEKASTAFAELNAKYHDIIVKAIKYTLTRTNDRDTTREIIELLQELAEKEQAELPNVLVKKLESIDFPLDKVNKNIWKLLDEPNANGQLTFHFNVAKQGSKKPVNIIYALDFSGLKNVSITKKLEPYDKRVYLAIGALHNAGYDVMNIQQIYNAMGYTGRASATDIKKINLAISKMNSARLYIDNMAEVQSKYKYEHFRYDGVLLPMERIQAIVNGQTADAAIHIFREPPMITFARQRGQITTINIKLLATDLSKTNANIELEDYLLEEINQIKRRKRNNNILYKTIYENTNIKTIKQRQRAPEKIRKILQHYKECGYIKDFTESNAHDSAVIII